MDRAIRVHLASTLNVINITFSPVDIFTLVNLENKIKT
jgi:hypothetical protein